MKAIRTVEKTGSISVALTDGMPKKENGEGSIYKCIMTKILQQGTLNRRYYTYVSFVGGGGVRSTIVRTMSKIFSTHFCKIICYSLIFFYQEGLVFLSKFVFYE